ncbi:MAG TPA: hypothetical protein VNH11_30900 [Pirellulales bacterium]|nr:hypothetical protein [Pirellulales bacterium]
MDATGDFVVTWMEEGANRSENARVFYANGTSTNAVQVGTATGSLNEGSPAVVLQPDGGGAFDLVWTDDNGVVAGQDQEAVFAQPFSSAALATQSPIVVYSGAVNQQTHYPGFASAAIDSNNDLLVDYTIGSSNTPPSPFTSTTADGEVYVSLIPDPPAAAPAAATPVTLSPPAAASPSSSSTAATDAVFAAYAYPEDDDTLG